MLDRVVHVFKTIEIISGTYVLVESDAVLIYGTFAPCTHKQTDKQTCLRSITIHDGLSSVQLLAPNMISHNGETLEVGGEEREPGSITITPTHTGYTVTVGNISLSWDGLSSYLVRVPCGTGTPAQGFLGTASCPQANTGNSRSYWLEACHVMRSFVT